MKLNRRSNNPSVDAAASFQNKAKFHCVKRSEREKWMPNWPFNMDVICFGRAYMDAYF
ncbi:hypothetical protein [uncultured Shewanella sp.]|uniref:hypothetical protein n=1 Tax=uncultured Shewanella sp. TaxID=173975 RepID=UPI002627311A|nr:hypothetical protein [uncultured Shewanella sp.]